MKKFVLAVVAVALCSFSFAQNPGVASVNHQQEEKALLESESTAAPLNPFPPPRAPSPLPRAPGTPF